MSHARIGCCTCQHANTKYGMHPEGKVADEWLQSHTLLFVMWAMWWGLVPGGITSEALLRYPQCTGVRPHWATREQRWSILRGAAEAKALVNTHVDGTIQRGEQGLHVASHHTHQHSALSSERLGWKKLQTALACAKCQQASQDTQVRVVNVCRSTAVSSFFGNISNSMLNIICYANKKAVILAVMFSRGSLTPCLGRGCQAKSCTCIMTAFNNRVTEVTVFIGFVARCPNVAEQRWSHVYFSISIPNLFHWLIQNFFTEPDGEVGCCSQR